eukprot:Skav229190  [mRNA]  locus=scaffold1004:387963:408551:+ [translate_table: standard]
MVMVCSLPVPRSFAPTFKMPFASMSKVTSIWGTPRGAGGTPPNGKCPGSCCLWRIVAHPAEPQSPQMAESRWQWRRPPSSWLGWWCSWGSTQSPHHQESRLPKKVVSHPAAQCPSHLLQAHQLGLQHQLPQPHQGSRSDWASFHPPTRKPSSESLGCVWSHRPGQSHQCHLHQASHPSKHSPPVSCMMSLLASCSNFARDKLSSMCLGPEASAVMKGKEILPPAHQKAPSWPSRLPLSNAAVLACPSGGRCPQLLEILSQPVDNHLVKVITTQVGVAVGGQHFTNTITNLQNRDIKGATSQIKHQNGLVVLLLQAICQRCCRRLVHDAQHVQPSNLASILCGLTLGVVEVGWDCHVAARYLPASALSLRSTCAETSSGANFLLITGQSIFTFWPSKSTLYDTSFNSSCTSPGWRPTKRFTE